MITVVAITDLIIIIFFLFITIIKLQALRLEKVSKLRLYPNTEGL